MPMKHILTKCIPGCPRSHYLLTNLFEIIDPDTDTIQNLQSSLSRSISTNKF